MTRLTVFIMLLIFSLILSAQESVEELLQMIEQNNPTLHALTQQRDAELVGTQTGFFPENPQMEFGFLRGFPGEPFRRTNFAVSQQFDFPLTYLYRIQAAKEMRNQHQWQWQKERQSLLLNARRTIVDLIYANALQKELKKNLDQARDICNAFERKFLRGEANILELNKTKYTLLNAEQDLAENSLEQTRLLAEIIRLNGGKQVFFDQSEFSPPQIPVDFTEWFTRIKSHNPQLRWLQAQAKRLNIEARLEKAQNLPTFSIGYMSETVENEGFKGLTLGFSIPLLAQRNRAKYRSKSATAVQEFESDLSRQFHDEMNILYQELRAREEQLTAYRSRLRDLDKTDLLRKALDMGEISIIEFLVEMSTYQSSRVRLLQMELHLAKKLAELQQYR